MRGSITSHNILREASQDMASTDEEETHRKFGVRSLNRSHFLRESFVYINSFIGGLGFIFPILVRAVWNLDIRDEGSSCSVDQHFFQLDRDNKRDWAVECEKESLP